jgi:D-alanyl-D-alanine carboxypeptidase
VPTLRFSALAAALAASILTAAASARAGTEATLLVDAETGKVLHAENATMPWYPASTSKLMTVYVTLQAVKAQRITLDTLFTVTARAASQPPSKIGFKPGTKITVDNALKILMVKSANDMAVVLAEGVSGSVENFSAEMNTTSKNLGMTQSSWVNPNGLPADEQISSARDLAILARPAPRFSRIRHVLAHPGDPARQEVHAQLQHADRPL